MELNQASSTENHEQLVEKAKRFVIEAAKGVRKDPHRLAYHIMADAGWINDPNGLVYFDGYYHVFFQYYPYTAEWGPMHWGHVRSENLVRWESMPVALAPGMDYDKGGCFSGSAVDNDGELTLIYTGHVDEKSPKEVQCIAVSRNGVSFDKIDANPVIAMPPVDGSEDFRDPKVWKYHDCWYMVVGTGKDGKGKAALYQSANLKKWEYVGVAAESNGFQGNMWECPDLFPIDDKHVLILSPMEMKNAKTLYIVGDMDYEIGKFTQGYYQEIDFGYDFYAPQTLVDPNGRRIMIAWMDMWGEKMPTQSNGWAGSMTIPREVHLLKNGRLAFTPVEELKTLRQNHRSFSNVKVEQSDLLKNVTGDSLEIVAKFDLSTATANEFGIKVRCSEDGREETLVVYNKNAKKLYVDRERSGTGNGGVKGGSLEIEGKTLHLHIFVDRSSIEVFGDGGRITLSNRIYPDPSSKGIGLVVGEGQVTLKSLDVWTLDSVW